MSNAVLTLTYADSTPSFPEGTVIDHIVVGITDTSASPPVSSTTNVAPGTTSPITFLNVAPGTYTASAQAVDASGAALGGAATTTFTVAAPTTVSLSLPASITATVA